MTDRACRACGEKLTIDNARTTAHRGPLRWVGACRPCETLERTARKIARRRG